MSKICFQVNETLFTAINQVFECLNLTGIEASLSFFCPCSGNPPHSAIPFFFNSKWHLTCSLTEQRVNLVTDHHLMWLKAPATETEKPSLPKLLKLNVVEDVGTNYLTLGVLLLNDETGVLVDSIEHDCLRQTHRITLKILQEWLTGKGLPPTWQTLTQTPSPL